MMDHPSRHTQFLSFCSDRIIWKKQPKGEGGYSSSHLKAQLLRAGKSTQKEVKQQIISLLQSENGEE